jgi:hypothetical protein
MVANRGELDGVRLLSEDRVLSFLERRPDYDLHDETYAAHFPMGMGAFHLAAPGVVPEPPAGTRVLNHGGAGGSIGWADVDSGLAFAICHNRMWAGLPDPPYYPLIEAIWEVAAEQAG